MELDEDEGLEDDEDVETDGLEDDDELLAIGNCLSDIKRTFERSVEGIGFKGGLCLRFATHVVPRSHLGQN